MEVARAIEDRWQALGATNCSVTLDVDAEVYRLGYGEFEALELLEQVGARLGTVLQRQPGIRIGVLVADDRVLVYTPVPELIEAGPRHSKASNALLLTAMPVSLEAELGVGSEGVLRQEIGLDKASRELIDSVHSELLRVPPRPFDVERRLRVFRAAFRFVELHMTGTQMSRHTVEVPTYLLGVADDETKARLRTILRIVPSDHKLAGGPLAHLRKRITDRFLRSTKEHGNIIRRSDEAMFLDAVKDLRDAVAAFKETASRELDTELQKRVSELTEALGQAVCARPPSEWGLARPFKDVDEAKTWLREDLDRAIGRADRYIGDMAVKLVFKEVTHESLLDQAFLEHAKDAFPDLQDLFVEQDAAPATTP